MSTTEKYGVFIEFSGPQELIQACEHVYESGFRHLDAYSPYPVEDLAEAMGFKRESVALLTLLGGLGGGVLAFGMQWYCNVYDYPINVAGRSMFSWPAFIPVTFELTVLGAALTGAFAMLALNRLPKYWHPAFNVPEFARASRDRFFLYISARDPLYDLERIRSSLQDKPVLSMTEVNLE